MSNSDIPENDSTENEIESPSDAPPPDWMKFATSRSEPSLTEENTPDWLKDIRAGKGSGSASQQETQEAEDDDPYAGMSDLERLLAEEGIDLDTVSEERPEGSEGMSSRDWLISTSDDEMIRKKLGAEELEEESPRAAPVAEVAPSPQEAEDDDPYAGMSDLERLLAEEGVDLSSVAEVRPQGSEGMSSRDWLISTSDDEMIRKKLGAEELEDTSPAPQAAPVEIAPAPVEEPEVVETAPPPAPVNVTPYEDDDMMVVVDDLPDWLQDVDDETPPRSEPVAMAADEGEDDSLPDWLSEEEDSGLPPAPVDEPDFEAVTATVDEDDDMMVVVDDLPDWLQDVDDETPPRSEPVAMAADEGEDDGLPDWLSEEEDVGLALAEEPEVEAAPPPAPIDTAADEDDDKMVLEDDLPDWLQDVEDEASPTPEPIVSDTDDMMVVEDDLPSWLMEEDDDSDVTPAAGPDFEAVSPAPIETGPEEDMTVVEDDLPDWLAASDDETVEEIEPSTHEMPDWLMEVEQDEDSGAEPSASSIEFAAPIAMPGEEQADDTDEEDLPDWLREVQDDSDEEMPSAFTEGDQAEPLLDDTTDEEDLPVWLREVQADEGEHPLFDGTMSVDDVVADEDLPEWLSEVQQPDEPFEPSEPSPQDVEDYIEDDLPAWLQEAAETSEEELKIEDVAPAPIPDVEASEEDEVPIDDKEFPAWLQDIEDEETETYEEDSVPIPEPIKEPPTEEPGVADEVSVPTPQQPAPVATAAPVEETSKKMPDWLKKLREGEEETLEVPPSAVQVQPTPPAPIPTPQPVVSRAAPPAPSPAPVTEDFGDLPHDADERLQIAQAARDKGDIDGAVHAYSSLISSGLYLDEIIEDMQQAIKSYPSNYLLYQTMGDAMMRDGRLQSALEAYREAMAKLSG